MALSEARRHVIGESPYAHEKEALLYAFAQLPDQDPYQAWGLIDLYDRSSGRLYEIDLLVIGQFGVYLVEIKSGPGRYEGDHHQWFRTPPGSSSRRPMEAPYRSANHKAKIIADELKRRLPRDMRPPRVEALVFLSAQDIDLKLEPSGLSHVLTRDTLRRSLTEHQYPDSVPPRADARLDRRGMRAISDVFRQIGFRPHEKESLAVQNYQLRDLLAEGAGWQDRVAVHRDQENMRKRARTYLVPAEASDERRAQLRRAAHREASILYDLREHPNVLRFADYVTDAPVGPTVLFDDFEGALPLDTFLTRNAELPFSARISIIEQVGRAIAHCHRRGITHGALAPDAVLVREAPAKAGTFEARIFNFQLGQSEQVSATQHWSAHAQDSWALYQAPEAREQSERTELGDMFSLGAVAYFAVTGRAPADSTLALDRILVQSRGLDPRTVSNDVTANVAEIIKDATNLSAVVRADDVDSWVDLLLDAVTAPPEPSPETSPLDAQRGMVISNDLEVVRVLGSGATARVLEVMHKHNGETRNYALKAPLDESHNARLAEEAEILKSLRHPRIVQLLGVRTIAGLPCLLLQLAGADTLQRELVRYGTVSLDEASRYGDDLFDALAYLEEQQIQHRDIKPANLGVGTAGKGRKHLTLFDFSLAKAPASDISVGTAAYRDPYLRLESRGAWDFAADRWSAAFTLHEMLTGQRPSFSTSSALDPDAKLVLTPERFEPAVRDGLVAFFERALARDASARYPSAESMRHAWVAVLAEPAPGKRTPAVPEAPGSATSIAEVNPKALSLEGIADDTLAASLPLSTRAKNALDRLGLLRAKDILSLSPNRLLAMRGVGKAVAQEIAAFKEQWEVFRALTPTPTVPFFSGFAGSDLMVHTVGLPGKIATALVEGGLPTLRAVATAATAEVEALGKRHGFAIETVRALLDKENRRANQRAKPTTLEGWLDALLPAKTKGGFQLARLLYGLEEPLLGVLDATVKDAATAKRVTQPAIYQQLTKLREAAAKHGAYDELRALILGIVEAAGGALPLRRAAAQLLEQLPHEAAPPSIALARAAALFRYIEDTSDAIHLLRVSAKEPWLSTKSELLGPLRAIGRAADTLARRTTLASPAEALRALQEAATETELHALPPEALLRLATEASEGAACSARLEIYPRGLPAERALELSASMFASPRVTEAEARRRVAARYPDAQPLPEGEALRPLLEALRFEWDATAQVYVRLGAGDEASDGTKVSSLGHARTALPTQRRAMDPEALEARQFDESLKHAVEMRALRILTCSPIRAREAALAIATRTGLQLVEFDRLLTQEIGARVARGEIKSADLVHSTDQAGMTGPQWKHLVGFLRAAATTVADEIAARPEPLLVTQVGILARYELADPLGKLVAARHSNESAALFLLLPEMTRTATPMVNGVFEIPGVLRQQNLPVSRAWLANRHNAAA